MPMDFVQQQQQNTALHVTQTIKESLHCLELSVFELQGYLQDAALSNPLLDLDSLCKNADGIFVRWESQEKAGNWHRNGTAGEPVDFANRYIQIRSFSQQLHDQVNQMQLLDRADNRQRTLCHFLVDCLDGRGYLSAPLTDIAKEIGQPLFLLEQALFTVQMLEPVGVGARDLSECLLLQLAQTPYFSPGTVRLIREGLPLLARQDSNGLRRLLKADFKESQRIVGIIRSLNPIPSRGFYTGESLPICIPEAEIFCEGGRLVVEMNPYARPHLSIYPEYLKLLQSPEHQEIHSYIREKRKEIQDLKRTVQQRWDTVSQLILALVDLQKNFFLGGDLKPITMGQMADILGRNISTISRAVTNKAIQFSGKTILLRDLFSSSVPYKEGAPLSSAVVKKRIQQLILLEDRESPLSDEELHIQLGACGISISRRTVAKYREELQILPSFYRKRHTYKQSVN